MSFHLRSFNSNIIRSVSNESFSQKTDSLPIENIKQHKGYVYGREVIDFIFIVSDKYLCVQNSVSYNGHYYTNVL